MLIIFEYIFFPTHAGFLWSPGWPAAHVVRTISHQDQQLPLPGGMMHPGVNWPARGRTADPLPYLEGRREGALTVRPCRHHSFMLFRQIFCEKPSKGHWCVWITAPQHDSSLVPTSARLCFLFLFVSSSLQHILPVLFLFTPPPPLFSLFHSSVDDVISSPFVRPLLGAFSFFFLAPFLFPPQMNLRARPPPFVDFVRRCWGLYIFF